MASPEEPAPLGASEKEQELYRQRILNQNPLPPTTTFPKLNVNGPMMDTNFDSSGSPAAELGSPNKKAKINEPVDIELRDAQDPDTPGFSKNEDGSIFAGDCVSPTQPFIVDGEGLGVGSDDELLPEAGAPAAHSPKAGHDDGCSTPIDLLTFQNSLTMMFKTLSDQMQNNNQQLMTEMGSFKSDVKTKLKQNALQIKKTATEQQASIDSLDKKICKDIATLTRRLAALEERDPISSTPRPTAPASAAPTAPAAEAAPDPWHAFNLEKELRDRNYKYPLKQQDSSFSSSSNNKKDFTPRFIHLQGWATFNDDSTGITQDDAKNLAEKIKTLLPLDCRQLVTDISAGRLLNSRISLRIRDGGEQCWTVKRKIDEALIAAPLMIRGQRVYAMVESSPTVRLKNRILAVATQVLSTSIGDRAAHLKKDYRAGTLYYITDLSATNPNYIPVGKLKRDNSWKWMKDALSSTLPAETPERLDELLAAALADE